MGKLHPIMGTIARWLDRANWAGGLITFVDYAWRFLVGLGGAGLMAWLFAQVSLFWQMLGWFGVASVALVTWYLIVHGLYLLTRRAAMRGVPSNGQPKVIASDNIRPDFGIIMRSANIFSLETGDTGIVLEIKVWNTGYRTAIVNWELFIVPLGGSPQRAQFSDMPRSLSLQGERHSAVLHDRDLLERKLAGETLGPEPLSGLLLFYTKVPRETVASPDTRLELTLRDTVGNTKTETQRIGDWLL